MFFVLSKQVTSASGGASGKYIRWQTLRKYELNTINKTCGDEKHRSLRDKRKCEHKNKDLAAGRSLALHKVPVILESSVQTRQISVAYWFQGTQANLSALLSSKVPSCEPPTGRSKWQWLGRWKKPSGWLPRCSSTAGLVDCARPGGKEPETAPEKESLDLEAYWLSRRCLRKNMEGETTTHQETMQCVHHF